MNNVFGFVHIPAPQSSYHVSGSLNGQNCFGRLKWSGPGWMFTATVKPLYGHWPCTIVQLEEGHDYREIVYYFAFLSWSHIYSKSTLRYPSANIFSNNNNVCHHSNLYWLAPPISFHQYPLADVCCKSFFAWSGSIARERVKLWCGWIWGSLIIWGAFFH